MLIYFGTFPRQKWKSQVLFLKNGKIIFLGEMLGDIYKSKQDEDGYLYITVSPMEAFGEYN